MILVIRSIGILNAAIWLGAAVFLLVAQGAFFSGEVKSLGLHPFWPGALAQMVLARYFYLQFACGLVAVAHLLAEWVYLGRPLYRFTFGLLAGLLLIALVGGLLFQPKLKALHLVKYSMSEDYKLVSIPAEQRIQAAESFKLWHGISSAMNLVALGGLVVYFWRVVHPPDNLRFVNTAKFRS